VGLEVEAKIGKGASLRLIGCNFGGKETKYSVSIMQEQESRCEHFEICLLGSAQRLIVRTGHLHTAPGSFSRSSFRYAPSGSAQVDVEGDVEISREAKGADVHFVAKSLLLSREARVRVVPKLSVKTGEVAAGHGAAMAPVSPDEMFYLETRGIDDVEGKRMIVAGFLLEPLISAKVDAKIMAAVEMGLLGKMGALDGI
jgi:Fe-S cluster assembly protein SufD